MRNDRRQRSNSVVVVKVSDAGADPFAKYGPWFALGFSVTAMHAAADRINRVPCESNDAAFAAIGEAVWWTTIVNDTLKRSHPDSYALAERMTSPSPTRLVEGLRSVRHRIGHEVDLVDFLEPVAARSDPGDGRVTAWRWKSIPSPKRRRPVDLEQHRCYEGEVAGRNTVETFMRATAFLSMAFANAQAGLPRQ